MLVIDSRLMFYNRKERRFEAEASTLEANCSMSRLDKDATGWYLTIRSQWTGALKRFYRVAEVRNRGNELDYVVFEDRSSNLVLHIFND